MVSNTVRLSKKRMKEDFEHIIKVNRTLNKTFKRL